MTKEQLFKNLSVPEGPIDVILDTDAFNEIDDQYAISYLLAAGEKLRIKGLCAAPFFNHHSDSPAQGMERSYQEICKLLKLAEREELIPAVYRGSTDYLKDEVTPQPSEAADFMATAAKEYSPEKPLYIVAIGAITNVASAILKNPEMVKNTVVVWLGGNGLHTHFCWSEFNMMQDVAAARVVFGCGVPLVQLPCGGIVDHFTTTRPELEYWLKGKNPLCDYLVEKAIDEAERYAAGKPWSRVIWDVTAVAWLLNDGERFMESELIPSPIPEYDNRYSSDPERHLIRYVTAIHRDALFEDLFARLGE